MDFKKLISSQKNFSEKNLSLSIVQLPFGCSNQNERGMLCGKFLFLMLYVKYFKGKVALFDN